MASSPEGVRRYLGDEAAPYRFKEAQIAAALARQEETPRGEILAAIDLLELAPSRGTVTSIKQGSTSRTFGTGGLTDAERIATLRGRLAGFDAPIGSSSLIAVVDTEAPMSDVYRSPLANATDCLGHFGCDGRYRP